MALPRAPRGWGCSVLSDRQIKFCHVMAQSDVTQKEAAEACDYSNPAKMGHKLMTMPKIKRIIHVFQEMQTLKSTTLNEDLESMKGEVTREWVIKKLVSVVLGEKTSNLDKIKALQLISQIKGYLTEQAPAHLTPIILNYEGKQLGSLAGVSSAIEN